MIKIFIYFLIFLASSPVLAKIFVLEFQSDKLSDNPNNDHHIKVSWVACGRDQDNCHTYKSPEFGSKGFANRIAEHIDRAQVVNMSFSINQPQFDYSSEGWSASRYEKYQEDYKLAIAGFQSEKETLTEIIKENPDKLFVIASGNGIGKPIMGGVGGFIKEKSEIYPPRIDAENTIKVAAVKYHEYSLGLWNEVDLTDYANYGLDYVDVAASEAYDEYNFFKPDNPEIKYSQILQGTSFAAPLVSRLADELIESLPLFSIAKIKEVLLKSCYVKNITSAIRASEDLIVNGEKSKTYRMMNTLNATRRNQLLTDLGNILLVKSGGVILPELVASCASQLAKESSLSVEQACLEAHTEVLGADQKQRQRLQKLWSLRGL